MLDRMLENSITLGLSRRVSQEEDWKERMEMKNKEQELLQESREFNHQKEVINTIRRYECLLGL